MERSYPRGFDFEVFGAEALREAHARADQPAEREHVTPYLYSRTTHSRVTRSIVRSADASAYRLTLDTEDDLALLRLLFEEHGAADLDVEQLISLLDDHPEIARMNAHIEQKKLED
jgi:spore coat polysaccharide biosynthesis protein SpsF